MSGQCAFAEPPGGLMWFTNQAEFEAFNAGKGNDLKGTEDYEESILNPGDGDFFDDSLESGVPNSPDGFPFPVGMTGLPNLVVQSNLSGGNPVNLNPRILNGLVAVAEGVAGAVSDVVAANFFPDSLDLIFNDAKSGVGFHSITLKGGSSVEVRVYSTTNMFLGMMTTPADPSGANFIGVWSSVPIGRINIFDPDNGAEAGDNIQAWDADRPPAALIWFTDQAEFEAFVASQGKDLEGIEDFEESILGPNAINDFDDSLESDVPNLPDGFPFPVGMTGLPNLIVQSNLSAGNPLNPNPRGVQGLAALSVGFLGAVSDVVTTFNFADSLDLIFTHGESGVGFSTLVFLGGTGVEVRVFSTANALMGIMGAVADPSGVNFIGVWSSTPIGRINIFDASGGAEGADNIQAWKTGSSLIWFTNQAEFEAFNQDEGKVLKGIEDYEESVLGPNAVDGFDDSLVTGVPNSPDGFPFPDGMTGLPNLIVQSNFEHTLLEPNPRGPDALAAFSEGVAGAVSDVVIANQFVDSLDLIFTDEKSGVGFNTISFLGAKAVEVNVFSTTNEHLGEMPSLADPSGVNFIGVWSSIPIGRINIFDIDDGAEGADNIQAWEAGGGEPCPWDLVPNGSVGIADLLLLLELWNNPYGIGDLLDLLADWGDCL